jgi:putative transposase
LLKSNHVHWIAIPEEADSLAQAFGEAHGRYAQYANARWGRHGDCAAGRRPVGR